MSAKPDAPSFTPRYSTLIALGLFAIWVVVLCFPMFSGQFIGSEYSDQTWGGIPFRNFWATEFHRTGSIPLWNPWMFGGMPFVGAMHGDIFYPTSFLRLFLRADQTLNVVFALHLFLAGLFTYVFLRALGRTWTSSVIGGLAYQLSGIVASQVSPGHDGKIAVSALLPLLLTGLLLGIRKRRLEGFGLAALMVGFDLLSPQTQTTQYSLIFAGLFCLYLCFVDDERPATPKDRWMTLGLATVAVALGFAISMIQMVPFIKYGAFSARVAGVQGWAYATAYAMPPANIVDWLTATFTGSHVWGNYWPGQLIKLHSEYVGAGVLALVALGVGNAPSRKLAWFLGGVWLLFVLVCLGPATPFYRLWYALVPGVKVTRAPGMAFFIPTFVFACFAAFGVERIERSVGAALVAAQDRQKSKVLWGILAGAGVLLILGVSGGIVGLAEHWASPDAYPIVQEISGAITTGAILAALAAGAIGLIALGATKGRLRGMSLALALAAVVSADLYINARRFFKWWPPEPQLFAPDEIITHLQRTPLPFRVMDLPVGRRGSTYPTNFLMYEKLPNVLGHHGNEMHNYDELLGGKNEWKNLFTPRLWNLLALRYAVFPESLAIPGYHVVARSQHPAGGAYPAAILFEADTVPPYARVVPAAAQVADSLIVPVLMNPQFDFDRVLLLSDRESLTLPSLEAVPPPSSSRASVTAWSPGAMTVRVDPVPVTDSWLLVSENWYPDWRATVDGQPATPRRGDNAFLSVALPRGAREVTFTFSRDVYNRGKMITLVALTAALAWIAVPPLLRRRSG